MAKGFLKSSLAFLWELPSPQGISFLWGFGSILGVLMTVQILSGVLLAFYYTSGIGAWGSVVELTREVSGGWAMRLVHANNASFVFLVLYIHFFRGIIQSSFFLKKPWLSGWVILALTMASAFLGYVLPWGQMSFWGATVIINLISVLPMGKSLVIWLWGGFYVSSFTCSFFYALHYILPFSVLLMVGVHLFFLHETGSSSPAGLSTNIKIKFAHLFSFKDLVNASMMWGALIWALWLPDWSADPVNFSVSDLSSSPLHIQPEWYFLHLYAVLRSIPNKMGGLIGFALAFILLLALSFVFSSQSLSQISSADLVGWSFLFSNLILMWLGSQPVESPFVMMGQALTLLYFSLLALSLLMDMLLGTSFA